MVEQRFQFTNFWVKKDFSLQKMQLASLWVNRDFSLQIFGSKISVYKFVERFQFTKIAIDKFMVDMDQERFQFTKIAIDKFVVRQISVYTFVDLCKLEIL